VPFQDGKVFAGLAIPNSKGFVKFRPRAVGRGLAFRSATRFPQPMLIAWTTVDNPQDAEALAAATVERGLAACVQISGMVSHYRWAGRPERAEELRLTFKFLEPQLPALEAFVLESHPYEVPEWVVIRAERVSEKYLSWVEANSTNQPL